MSLCYILYRYPKNRVLMFQVAGMMPSDVRFCGIMNIPGREEFA